MAGEAKNPKRDVSRAVITAMLRDAVYVALEIAFIGSLNPRNLAHGLDQSRPQTPAPRAMEEPRSHRRLHGPGL
ncbi:MAG: Amino acid transporter [Frankiales bacterium]|nr:Amino acid transporter [Frankiales bacterium]